MEIRYVFMFVFIGTTVADVWGSALDIRNFQKEIKEITKKTYEVFRAVAKELVNNRLILKTTLLYQFETMEISMASKQDEEVQVAVQKGMANAEKNIESCVRKEQERFRAKRDTSFQTTMKCINQITQKFKNQIDKVRKTYINITVLDSKAVEDHMEKSCKNSAEDLNCVQKSFNEITKKIKEMKDNSNQHLLKIKDVTEKQKTEMETCRQNFSKKLKILNEKHNEMVNECVENALIK